MRRSNHRAFCHFFRHAYVAAWDRVELAVLRLYEDKKPRSSV